MEWDLKNWADPVTLKRGAAYHKKGAVRGRKVSTIEPHTLVVEAEVDEGSLAPAHVRLDWNGQALEARCSCPMPAPCKHAIATGRDRRPIWHPRAA